MRPYLYKNPSQKRAGRVVQGIGPEFKHQYCKKKKKKRKVRRCEGISLRKKWCGMV
jgi:hypothetical protein